MCQGQPVRARARARTLTHTHTCSGRFVQLVRNVKDPDPLCLALDPTPFRLTLTRARAHIVSPNYPGEVGETPPFASRRPGAQSAYLLPAARRRKEATEAAKKGRIQKKAHEKKEEKSGGETQEGEGGGERREMKSLK